ncbi:MAG TPA: HNH endonuclease [Kofleriaceae bacterium]|nr:HNH endonuclease [Kofleriaceae bacterium]
MAGLCTFCDNPLDGSEEHIVHSAIGGRKTSTRIVCGFHNNLFGRTIDRTLTDQLAVIGNLLGIRTGRNQPPATIRGLETLDGQRVDLEPGGRLVMPRSIVRDEPADGRNDISISSNTVARVRELTAQYMRRFPGRRLENATVVESIEPTCRPVRIDGGVGGEETHRAVAKIAILMLASELGTEAMRGPSTIAIRRFVLDGADSADFVRMDYGTPFPDVAELGSFPTHAHRVAVFADPISRVACGFIELFGTFRYTVLVSDAWDGSALALIYAVDPIAARQAQARVVRSAPLTADRFRAIASSSADGQPRLERLWQVIDERVRDQRITRVIHEVFAEMFPPERTEPPTVEERARAAREITARFMAEQLGIPYTRSLPLETIVKSEVE